MKIKAFIGMWLVLLVINGYGQGLQSITVDRTKGKWVVTKVKYDTNETVSLSQALPLVSLDVCVKNQLDALVTYTTADPGFQHSTAGNQIKISWKEEENYAYGVKGTLTFENVSRDTLWLTNVLPLGRSSDHVYITGVGEHPLSRTYLFRPGKNPVNCIVPDNAWELGFASLTLDDPSGICALSRREGASVTKGKRRRFETELEPGGTVQYTLYFDRYQGDWQEGLRLIFQKRLLYDVEPGTFSNTLFERKDLQWMRHSYVIHLMMGWDHYLYDREKGQYQLDAFLKRGQALYGGDDAVGIWPTWPVLGLDQRNQWDMFRSLPGGLDSIRALVAISHQHDARFFICYNPWDESTRYENHLQGMAELIAATQADGVVLDTRGSSSQELQQAADSVKEGVVMYSEGMAVPKDMAGIVSGRVHNALYYPPLLNLNKFIKPDFAIFRVAELSQERIRREYATSFFNGYGTELNIFRAGKPSWMEEDYRFLGATSRILRENTSNFIQAEYTPLLPTLHDSIYVNRWPGNDKVVYTIFSLHPAGYQGPLFPIEPKAGYHWVDLWNHELITPDTVDGQPYAPVHVSSFDQRWLGTNNEGAVGAIARLPERLQVERTGDQLWVKAAEGDSIRIWAGLPAYDQKPLLLAAGEHELRLTDHFGSYEGKFVVQLLADQELLDEQVFRITPGEPRLISQSTPTQQREASEEMVSIPPGTFTMEVTQGDQFIAYPTKDYPKQVHFSGFFMDRYPVTNQQYDAFIKATGYQPKDTTHFLKHWQNGKVPAGKEDHPVVYVTYEDAKAYAAWCGKRLPTEAEWQYAAQTAAQHLWPWTDDQIVTDTSQRITSTLQVINYEGLDTTKTNPGNGQMQAVGSYPTGANPLGIEDLVGSVWQMTHDLYRSASYDFIILKGGSYYKPTDSWWYVQGGPRPLPYRQMWLRVSPGFERNATVGFRCVRDQSDKPSEAAKNEKEK